MLGGFNPVFRQTGKPGQDIGIPTPRRRIGDKVFGFSAAIFSEVKLGSVVDFFEKGCSAERDVKDCETQSYDDEGRDNAIREVPNRGIERNKARVQFHVPVGIIGRTETT
jgi:hypothetical protein